MMSILMSFFFPPPPSLFIMAMTIVSFTSLAYTGLSEIRGKHLHYSKFWNVGNSSESKKIENEIKISSRVGMLLFYGPAAAAAAASFFVPGLVVGLRAQLLSWALFVQFFKRVLEVLFIHQYSGQILLSSAVPITSSYLSGTVSMIYTQYLSQNMTQPSLDLKYLGLVLFLIGIAGNFYHHFLLSKLRQKNEKGYNIPKGGLFGLIICPHYLFEIIAFYGITLIAQTMYALSFALGTTVYLIGRSFATRKWYLSKFERFPREVKALIPYIF